jgi:hypothetical protein
MKNKETLEEYSNGLYKQSLKDDVDLSFYDGVRLGAKWQADRMYSEEEVLKLLLDSEEYTSRFNGRTNLRSWFEQFKKK